MASNGKFINIAFPFKDSERGDFLKLNNIDKYAIKSDLMHLLLTRKGQRLYMPDFGTDLLKYIFEQNDSTTHNDIKREVSDAVKKYLPNLSVNDILIENHDGSEYAVSIRIDYTVTIDAFKETDFVTIQL